MRATRESGTSGTPGARLPAMLAALIALVGPTAGCVGPTDGPPEIVVDRTACDHCGMLVSELRFAGAYRLPSGETKTFDDLGCMRDELAGEAAVGLDIETLSIWVQDGVGGGWIDARTAWYVESPAIATPMGHGIQALADEAAARALLSRLPAGAVHDFGVYHDSTGPRVEHTGAAR